jgi:hypothetical protein
MGRAAWRGGNPTIIDFPCNSRVIVRRSDIEQVFLDAGVGVGPLLADTRYAMPTENWLASTFADYYQSKLSDVGLTDWRLDLWDCDNFTRAAALFCDNLHARDTDAPKGTGLAFGEFWYRDKTVGAHAINVAVTKDSNGLRPVFFEPQNAAKGSDPIVQLTPEEIQSCAMYRF